MKKIYKVLIIVFVVLVVFRIALPHVILYYANKNLAGIPGYYGHINDIDLVLYRGAYTIKYIYINKVDTLNQEQTDFFKARAINLALEWSSILSGAVVGELLFYDPVLIFTKDKVDLEDVKNDSTEFSKLLNDFMPLTVNRFEAINGDLRYADNSSTPKVDVAITEVYILAINLSNIKDDMDELPSTVTASANLYEGTFTLDMKLNALNILPTFDLNASVDNINLAKLNDFLRAYGNFDVNQGTFGLYTEMATKGGKFKGYVKPIIINLDVVGPEDKADGFLAKVYEHIIGAGGVLLRNQKKNQVATKIEIEGDFNDPKSNTINAMFEVLRNAFIQALMPSVDNEISLQSIEADTQGEYRKLLQRVFQSTDTENKEK